MKAFVKMQVIRVVIVLGAVASSALVLEAGKRWS